MTVYPVLLCCATNLIFCPYIIEGGNLLTLIRGIHGGF
jgi:hypothetical protein